MVKEAREFVRLCNSCTLVARKNPPVPMLRTEMPQAVWDHLAMDFNGPYARFGGIQIVLLVDYYSRYLVAGVVNSTDFASTESFLEEIFKRYGYPKSLKADSGPPFNSNAFSKYCKDHGIAEIHSAPLFPQQNGCIERYMQLVNKAMQIATLENKDFRMSLSETIRAHNSADHRVTGIAPETLMFNRKMRRGLPLASEATVDIDVQAIKERDSREKALAKSKEDKKRRAKDTKLQIGDSAVIMRKVQAKGDSRFDPTPWKVVAKNRGDLELESPTGARTKRNVTMVKKLFTKKEDDDEHFEERNEELNDKQAECARDDQPNELPRRSSRIRTVPPHLKAYVRWLSATKID